MDKETRQKLTQRWNALRHRATAYFQIFEITTTDFIRFCEAHGVVDKMVNEYGYIRHLGMYDEKLGWVRSNMFLSEERVWRKRTKKSIRLPVVQEETRKLTKAQWIAELKADQMSVAD